MHTMRCTRAVASALVCMLTNVHLPAIAQVQTPGAAPKLRIVIIEGEGAINNLRQRVAREPIVQVEDENRKPIAGAAVTFLLPQQGAGATFANGSRSLTILTDSNGRAVARGLQANNLNGQYEIRVTASHQGETANTTIRQSNVAAAGAAAAGVGLSLKLLAIVGAAAGAAVAGGVIASRGGNDGNGNGNTPPRPGTVIVPGTPSVGGPQ